MKIKNYNTINYFYKKNSMSTFDTLSFQKAWFSQEEIIAIQKWEQDILDGKLYDISDMKKVKQKILSEYEVNV